LKHSAFDPGLRFGERVLDRQACASIIRGIGRYTLLERFERESVLNKAQPAAEHPPARAPRAEAEDSAAEESLPHHAQRVVVSRVHAIEKGLLDPLIAMLQRLRKGAVGAEGDDDESGEDGHRPRKARSGGGHGAPAHADEGEDEAPKPKRRLLPILIYFSVFLTGGMGGGALAYELLSKLLDRQATESRRLEAAMAKQAKSVASNQKNLEAAEAKRTEAENKLVEAQKKQAEAEKKLESALADTKAAADKQKKLDDAVKLLEQIRGPERAGSAPRPPSAGGNAERKQGPPKAGDCTLAPGNIGALKDCVKDFNR
jgi:hypothetical protein